MNAAPAQLIDSTQAFIGQFTPKQKQGLLSYRSFTDEKLQLLYTKFQTSFPNHAVVTLDSFKFALRNTAIDGRGRLQGVNCLMSGEAYDLVVKYINGQHIPSIRTAAVRDYANLPPEDKGLDRLRNYLDLQTGFVVASRFVPNPKPTHLDALIDGEPQQLLFRASDEEFKLPLLPLEFLYVILVELATLQHEVEGLAEPQVQDIVDYFFIRKGKLARALSSIFVHVDAGTGMRTNSNSRLPTETGITIGLPQFLGSGETLPVVLPMNRLNQGGTGGIVQGFLQQQYLNEQARQADNRRVAEEREANRQERIAREQAERAERQAEREERQALFREFMVLQRENVAQIGSIVQNSEARIVREVQMLTPGPLTGVHRSDNQQPLAAGARALFQTPQRDENGAVDEDDAESVFVETVVGDDDDDDSTPPLVPSNSSGSTLDTTLDVVANEVADLDLETGDQGENLIQGERLENGGDDGEDEERPNGPHHGFFLGDRVWFRSDQGIRIEGTVHSSTPVLYIKVETDDGVKHRVHKECVYRII